MANYRVFETARFIKDLELIKGPARGRFFLKLANYVYPQLRQEPHFGSNIKKLAGFRPDTWRYRIGDFRAFYEISEKDKLVYMIAFEPRHSAY